MSSSKIKYWLFYVTNPDYAEIYADSYNNLYAYTCDKSIYKMFKSQRNMDTFTVVKSDTKKNETLEGYLMDNLEKGLGVSSISYPYKTNDRIEEKYMDIALTISEREHLCSLDVGIQTNLTASTTNINFMKIFKDKYWLGLYSLDFHKFYAHSAMGNIYMPTISYFDILLSEFGPLFKYVGEVENEK